MSIKLEATYIVVNEGKLFNSKDIKKYLNNLDNGTSSECYTIVSFGDYKHSKLTDGDKKIINEFKSSLIIRHYNYCKLTVCEALNNILPILEYNDHDAHDIELYTKLDALHIIPEGN